jgi:hypothetical protein
MAPANACKRILFLVIYFSDIISATVKDPAASVSGSLCSGGGAAGALRGSKDEDGAIL